jgi:hypothetical protein
MISPRFYNTIHPTILRASVSEFRHKMCRAYWYHQERKGIEIKITGRAEEIKKPCYK